MRTSRSRLLIAFTSLGIAVFPAVPFATTLEAQQVPGPGTPPVPQIHASASEEVEIAPDRAMVSLAVESRERTAAGAGAENARIQTAVLDTLRKLGIETRHIRTQGVSVTPEYQYPRDGGRPTVIGYRARNTIQVEVQQIARVGTVIDAALGRGVTNVGGLQFFSSTVAEARREAMRKAVARVKADAEAIAVAAGGSLGPLLEITANADSPNVRPYDQGPMLMARAEQADARTPIEAGQIRVTAHVSARFTFVPR